MKTIKLLAIIFSLISLAVILNFCWPDSSTCGEDYVLPIPTPLWIDYYAASCPGGALCSLANYLHQNEIVTEDDFPAENYGLLVDDLNQFWHVLADQLKSEGFDKELVRDAFQNAITKNKESLISFFMNLLHTSPPDISNTDSSGFTCETIIGDGNPDYVSFKSAINDFQPATCPANEGLLAEINPYVEMIGLTVAQACELLKSIIRYLDSNLGLSAIIENIETNNMCGDTFEYTSRALNTNNLDTLLVYLSTTGETDGEWVALLSSMFDNEMQVLMDGIIDLLYGVHYHSVVEKDVDPRKTLLAGMIDQLPTLIGSLLFDSE